MQWVVSWNLLRNKSTKPPLSPPMDDGEDGNSKLQEAEAEQQMQQDDHDGRRPDSSEETLMRIPGEALVNLVEAGEEVSDSVQLGSGEFSIVKLVQGNTGIALFVKVGEDVRWPLTKDEPALKLDSRHYLFSIRPLPDEEAADKDSPEIVNYGVKFAVEEGLDLLDTFLQQHACLSLPTESTVSAPRATESAKGGSGETEKSEPAYWAALTQEAEAEQQMQQDDHDGRRPDFSEETLMRIPGEALVNLVEAGEEVSDSVQLGSGEFSIVKLVQGNTGIALFVKVGEDVRWPLTKDEPALKLDSRHYLFSIRPPPDEEAADKDSPEIVNYGVKFAVEEGLDLLDTFLQQHACLSLPTESTVSAPRATESAKGGSGEIQKSEAAYWAALAPSVEDYNSVLGKAVAAGTGKIIKGLFVCTNAYASQVQKGGNFVRSRLSKAESETAEAAGHQKKKINPTKISPRTKTNTRRVKHLSMMAEKLSNNVVAGVVTVSGAVIAPVVGSNAGQKFFATQPGDVLLASLDAFNKVLEAAGVAGKDALLATSKVTVEIVEHRFGEETGEVTHDSFAAAGYGIGTAWNVTKVAKAINPVTNGTVSASSLKRLKMKNAGKEIISTSK